MFVLLLLFPSCRTDVPARQHHAKVTLISEQRSIQPGHELWVGLHFDLEKHWHIYWINPGDSGEPPRVTWDLPQGFAAGPLVWPAPERLGKPPIVDYGYEGEVLLMAPFEPPRDLPVASTVHLRATVKWLVCRDICVPEEKRVVLSLPIRTSPPETDSRWRPLFEQARAQVPTPMPGAWSAAVLSEPDHFILTIKTGSPESNAAFFPLVPLEIENAAPQEIASARDGVRLTLQKSDQFLKPIAFLKGILILGDGNAVAIEAPVTARGDSKKPR